VVNGQPSSVVAVHRADEVPVQRVASQLLLTHVVQFHAFQTRSTCSVQNLLFNKIFTCPNHILRTLLPPPTAQNYSLRNRPHDRQLIPDRISRITDCNFTVRMLYVLSFIYFRPALCFILVYNCGLTVRNKRICYVMFCLYNQRTNATFILITAGTD